MPRTPSYRYNLYKIDKRREGALKSHIESKGMSEIGSDTCGEYAATFYLCTEPAIVDDIWWVKQFGMLIPDAIKDEIKNSSYFGVVLYSSDTSCFAIPLGKSHFFLREFGEQDFGVELACRIADDNSVKMVNSRSFGGKKTKSIATFGDDARLELENGESLEYLQATTRDEGNWGKKGSFGSSAALTLPICPENMDQVLNGIEEKLASAPLFEPPRAISVKSKELKALLDADLSNALSEGGADPGEVHVDAVQLNGIEFIFRDAYRCFLRGPGRRTSEILENLSLEQLQAYAQEMELDLAEVWNDIKVVHVNVNDDLKFTEKLRHTISFVTDRDGKYYFLKDGKWFEFSPQYVHNLIEAVREITWVDSDSALDLHRDQHQAWRDANPTETVNYPEYWYNSCVLVNAESGFICYDRKNRKESGYIYEPLDVYDPATKTFIFVKRWEGKTSNAAYLIDQAVNTIKLLGPQNLVTVHGDSLECGKARLLIIKEGKRVNSVDDIGSLIILQKLNAFKQECRRKSIDCEIQIQYEYPAP